MAGSRIPSPSPRQSGTRFEHGAQRRCKLPVPQASGDEIMKSSCSPCSMPWPASARLAALLASLWIAGCSTLPTPAELKQRADGLASAADWTPLSIPAGDFTLAAYLSPVRARGEALTIYIEDDGTVWLDPST